MLDRRGRCCSPALRAQGPPRRWNGAGAIRARGVAASGTFTTKDAPDADGFYEITAIKGEANGVAITGLQPPGTSIPGNDGYPVDNLVRTEAPQLSMHGFGYALADGTYANPFYGAHFAKPDTYAFFSDPANAARANPPWPSPRRSRHSACLRGAPSPRPFRLDHDGRLYERRVS